MGAAAMPKIDLPRKGEVVVEMEVKCGEFLDDLEIIILLFSILISSMDLGFYEALVTAKSCQRRRSVPDRSGQ